MGTRLVIKGADFSSNCFFREIDITSRIKSEDWKSGYVHHTGKLEGGIFKYAIIKTTPGRNYKVHVCGRKTIHIAAGFLSSEINVGDTAYWLYGIGVDGEGEKTLWQDYEFVAYGEYTVITSAVVSGNDELGNYGEFKLIAGNEEHAIQVSKEFSHGYFNKSGAYIEVESIGAIFTRVYKVVAGKEYIIKGVTNKNWFSAIDNTTGDLPVIGESAMGLYIGNNQSDTVEEYKVVPLHDYLTLSTVPTKSPIEYCKVVN